MPKNADLGPCRDSVKKCGKCDKDRTENFENEYPCTLWCEFRKCDLRTYLMNVISKIAVSVGIVACSADLV